MLVSSAVRRELAQRRTSQPVPVPPPLGGLNTRDNLSQMPVGDAVSWDNWFPALGYVPLRSGFAEHATGLGSADVETIMKYDGESASRLLAAANSRIYDVTGGSTTQKGASFSNNKWQWTNASNRLIAVNGADTPQLYDGSTLTSASITLSDGEASTTLIGVHTHRSRVYAWADNSADFYYGATNAVQGNFTKFSLSLTGRATGKLIAIDTLTRDGGDGSDDIAVFIMNTGQVAVYQGGDPGSATDWALIGVFRIPEPINRRSVRRLAGDLLVVTKSDIISLSSAMAQSGLVTRPTKLTGAIIDAAAQWAANFGWELVICPEASQAIINVPQASAQFIQLGYNTVTGAAFRYTGIPSVSWGEFDGDLYFGSTDGKVMKFTGNDDNGSVIEGVVQQAWTQLGGGGLKKIESLRPVMSATGTLDIGVRVGTDFMDPGTPTADVTSGSSGNTWDNNNTWDALSWSEENTFRRRWTTTAAEGMYFGLKVAANSNGAEIRWFSTDYLVQTGYGLT